jgi:hypothetical protein
MMALWTPAEITTALWIDLSDSSTLFDAVSGGGPVTNGVGIARAEDKSGNARHFTQSTPGARPTWTSGAQNGLGVGSFDGGDWLTSVSANSVWTFLHSSQSTVFAVIRPGVIANPNAVYSILGSNAGSTLNVGVIYIYDDRAIVPRSDAFVGFASNTVSQQYVSFIESQNFFSPNATQSIAIQSDPANATSSSRIAIAKDGFGYAFGSATTLSATANAPSFPLQIGANGNGAAALVGNFCELIIVPSLLANADRQIIDGYTHWKWGLQSRLPADHPFKNDPPITGGSSAAVHFFTFGF